MYTVVSSYNYESDSLVPTSLNYLPPVRPSAIALGTLYTHATALWLLGKTCHKFKTSNSKEEFLRSRETALTAAAYGSSLVGSAIQTYGVAALLNATGTLTYKGAAYMGGLIFAATTVPSVCFAYILSCLSHANLMKYSLSSCSRRRDLLTFCW